MDSLDEKRKTASNSQAEILDARVIANYGDPGLDEDYHFDLLSRYIIVMIESSYRIVTKDKWMRMFAVVQRPRNLWVRTTGGVTGNPSTQKRADAQGNVNVGLSNNFSVRGIQRINQPYQLGELIKIRKSPSPATVSTFPAFFQSDFHVWNDDVNGYNPWHTEGASVPYINNETDKLNQLRQKTIEPITGDASWNFNFYLNKTQYEAFMLSIADASVVNNLTTIFQGEWNQGTPVYSAHGGYLFKEQFYTLLSSCEYEDVNVTNKMRVGANDCIPLVVTTPNSFPTPKTRAVGTISYTPTYSPVSI